MEIVVLGLNHKTAPVEVREKLAIPASKAGDLLRTLAGKRIFDERLLLSTCNRTEIYGVGTGVDSIRRAKEFLSEYSNTDLSLFEDKLYVLRQPESVAHLFSVAAGLDSMVLGETEITGQVKDAYLSALENRQTGKVLNALFQRSLKVAKEVRTQTGIGSGRVSVASVAVDLAGKIFESLDGSRVLVLGTGEMATQVTRAMISKGAKPMIVSSRHHDRAVEMAAELGGEAVAFDDFELRITEADVLVASTAAPRAIVHEAQVKSWMKARHERPLFIVDVAVPRNVEAAVDKIDNVYLYNIDDLHGITDKNRELRESQLADCLGLVGRQTQFFMDWFQKEFGARDAASVRV